MANIGRLSVDLIARTARFKAGIASATKSIKGFGLAIGPLKGLLATAFAGVAIQQSVGRFTRAISNTSKEIDRLAKTAKKLGIASEELVGLRYAAKLSGVEVKTFDMALQRMTRRVAEASIGTGEAKDALKELGIDAKELVRQPLGEQFLAIARAMGRIGNQSTKVRLAFKLFDSEGVALVNVLNQGEEAIRAMMAETAEFGSAVDAYGTTKVEAMQDSITRAKEAWTGLKTIIATEVAPVVTVLFVDLSNSIKGVNQGLLKTGTITESITWAIQKLAEGINILRRVPSAIRLPLTMFSNVFLNTLETFGIVAKGTSKAYYDIWKETDAKLWRELGENTETFTDRVKKKLGELTTTASKQVEALNRGDYGGYQTAGQRLWEMATGFKFTEMEKYYTFIRENEAKARQATIGRLEAFIEANKAFTQYGMNQGNWAQAAGAVGQAGMLNASNRGMQTALQLAEAQVEILKKIETNTSKGQGYATAAPG